MSRYVTLEAYSDFTDSILETVRNYSKESMERDLALHTEYTQAVDHLAKSTLDAIKKLESRIESIEYLIMKTSGGRRTRRKRRTN